MRALEARKRFSQAVFSFSSCSRLLPDVLSSHDDYRSTTITNGNGDNCLLRFPWSFTQHRGVRVNASHVRPGNVIEKTGKIYQVLDAEHKQRGRGGAMMQMELRDVDTGNKVSLRFGTEEAVERVFVQDKSFTCLYTENETAFVIDSETFEQLEVPLELFGKAAAYLTEGMKVTLQLYDGRPLCGSMPKRVACTIKEIHASTKGPTVTPRYQRALLDNGVTVMVPSYLEIGEEIFVNPEDDSYLGRAK
ncbi:elongation factor P-like [Melia azedarach]|uniref:Elongation factor P-like n=1 Tax=Melia azedarach TaxID=155640 RepID=A0ACC1YJT3_MELAZ|nr:elongation factor P-like [Melia azedarach]